MVKRRDIRTLEQHPQPLPQLDSSIHSNMQAQFRSFIPSDIQSQVEPQLQKQTELRISCSQRVATASKSFVDLTDDDDWRRLDDEGRIQISAKFRY